MAYGNALLLAQRGDTTEIRALNRVPLRQGGQPTFREELLQEIIDRAPEVLPVRDFYPSVTALCSLGREIPVDLVGRQGYIDNLLVTDDGHLVLVETKLWRNPEAVREVVAQVLEYTMAITRLSLLELEGRIRQSDRRGARLKETETVADRVQGAAADGHIPRIAEDFEDALASFRQTGEMLVLVVADSIQMSAERLTRWLDETLANTSPIKFGLVELRFFETDAGKIVVPKTLLRTREISRHTIVVEVRSDTSMPVKVTVRDSEPNRPAATRSVGKPDTVLTREALLEQVRTANPPETYETVTAIFAGLDSLGLATKGTPTMFLYGLSDGSAFHTLAAFSSRYLWCQIPARLRAMLGDSRFVDCKRALNRVATFYRPEDVDDPTKVNALTPRYDAVAGKASEFVDAIRTVASLAQEANAGR